MPGLMKGALFSAARIFMLTAAACTLIPGCSSLRPKVADSANSSAQEVAAKLSSAPSAKAVNFDQMKAVVAKLRADIVAQAEEKNGQSWNAGLTTLVGGSMATIGSVASRRGLTNTGIVLALLGLAGDQFYKPVNTIDVHMDADSRLMCIADATFNLTEEDRAAAANTNFDGADEARKAVDTMNATINATLLSYRRSLLGIRPGTPTREEIIGFMKRYAEDQAAGGAKGVPSQDRDQQELAAKTKKFSGLSTTLQACVKLGVPVTR